MSLPERISTGFVERGGIWVLGQLVLILAVTLIPVMSGTSPGLIPAAARLAGWILVGTGAALFVLGAASLGKSLTPFPKPLERSRLRQTGVYRIVRHPIYSGLTVAAFGWAVLHASLAGMATAVVLLLFLDRKAGREERWLLDKFPEYREYRQHVRKLIPWLY